MNCFAKHAVVGLVFTLALAMSPVLAQHGGHGDGHGDHGHGAHAQKTALPNCPIMDEPINLAVSAATDDGPVYFCCEGCIAKYQKNPEKYATKVAAQRKALADRAKVQVTCPVSKESVDRKVFVESKGEKVYLCCKDCAGKYESDPAKYASALANSYTYQTNCPVMGKGINPAVFTKLSTGETIYYCCPGCDKSLQGNPAKYNKKLVSQGILVNWAEVKKADSGKGHEGHDHGAHGHEGHGH